MPGFLAFGGRFAANWRVGLPVLRCLTSGRAGLLSLGRLFCPECNRPTGLFFRRFVRRLFPSCPNPVAGGGYALSCRVSCVARPPGLFFCRFVRRLFPSCPNPVAGGYLSLDRVSCCRADRSVFPPAVRRLFPVLPESGRGAVLCLPVSGHGQIRHPVLFRFALSLSGPRWIVNVGRVPWAVICR